MARGAGKKDILGRKIYKTLWFTLSTLKNTILISQPSISKATVAIIVDNTYLDDDLYSRPSLLDIIALIAPNTTITKIAFDILKDRPILKGIHGLYL